MMSYTIDLVTMQAIPTVVARDTLPPDQISARILQVFDRVYAFLETSDVEQTGQNVALVQRPGLGHDWRPLGDIWPLES